MNVREYIHSFLFNTHMHNTGAEQTPTGAEPSCE